MELNLQPWQSVSITNTHEEFKQNTERGKDKRKDIKNELSIDWSFRCALWISGTGILDGINGKGTGGWHLVSFWGMLEDIFSNSPMCMFRMFYSYKIYLGLEKWTFISTQINKLLISWSERICANKQIKNQKVAINSETPLGTVCWKNYLCSILLLPCSFVKDLLTVFTWVYFWAVCSLLLIYLSILCQFYTALITVAL